MMLRSDGEEQGGLGEQRSSPARPPFGKKQLPSIPKNAVPITKAASPASSTQSANGTHASYGPFYLEYSLLAEFTLVIKQKLPGIYVQPSYRSALMWFGVIFIRHGLYQDGVFKFTVYIPDNYPDGDCPRVVFDTPVFHPLVDPVSGELDVRRAFTKWRRNHNHIWQVLMYARTIFYKINTMDPLNPEAAVLFSPWNPAVHEEAKEKMFAHKRRPEDYNKGLPMSGLSWVKPGSTQPFSKEDNPLQT
ncbi:AKT-interacting isoform X1 [Labeo rohita]|uniref:AKT-interacting isoform X1 n=1 Tax=Labeo rohita TaxID=84645 RepID=A0A498MJ32_LABRO|nr:AKT-interacting isoform X1 [Labeo rohita]